MAAHLAGGDLDGAVQVLRALLVRPAPGLAGILRAAGAQLHQQAAARGLRHAGTVQDLTGGKVVVHAHHHQWRRGHGLGRAVRQARAMRHQRLRACRAPVPHMHPPALRQQQARQGGAHLAETDH
jgi:hypothetical protein